jgi:hypothetical protein
MKATIILITLCLFSTAVIAQKGRAVDLYIAESDINRNTADSLLRAGNFYQIFYAGGDFRQEYCIDSLCGKYNFKQMWFGQGCVISSESVFDSIETFNAYMGQKLDEKNGAGWNQKFKADKLNCVKCLCPLSRSLSEYGGTSVAGFFYQKGQVNLDSAQKCIIRYTIFSVLEAYPKLTMQIVGNSSCDEEDSTKSVSRKRAENYMDYLAELGISNSRLSITWNGCENLYIIDNPNADKNRRINLVATSSKY